MSAEYIMAEGNEQVILCERGIRTYETMTRNTLDISAVPVLKWLSHLPVIVDPSHASGISWLIEPLAIASAAVGADGLIIEVHNDPSHALCDGAQAITEMRRLNERIQDEKVSAAIDQMERISGKIFAQVQSDPEKLPQIRRFMDYYLPTTLKLLRAYDEMSSQGVAGENISGTMAKVEQMLDTIVTAFARQLDGLFGADAMDISTDISAMEAMLAREGLTGEQLTAETIKNMDGTDIKLE